MKIRLIFFIIFCTLVAFIFTQKNRIDTDFFSIIEDSGTKNHKEIFINLNKKLNKEIIFLVQDKNASQNIIKKLNQSLLFSHITYTIKSDFKQVFADLDKAKLALLNKDEYNLLQTEPLKFFQKNAKDFFSPFQTRILNPNEDFFNLSKSGIKNNSKIYLDPKDGLLHVKDKNKTYFFINASLKKDYKPKELLLQIKQIQKQNPNNTKLLISGGAIYSALGKQQGESQSLYMSLISLSLSAFLLIFVFRNIKILSILIVAIFGLTLGLSCTFLYFKNVHIISLILSSSLVGLMYDFTIHWLSFNTKTSHILPIQKMKRVFLIGLFVTVSGYGIFAFAPLDILKQTAVFSIFALFGAFLCTYFLMPNIFQNEKLQASQKSLMYITYYEKSLQTISQTLHVKTKLALLAVFAGILTYTFLHVRFEDDIRSYASTPPFWINQAKEISRLTNFSKQSRFIIAKKNPQELIKEFKKQNIQTSSIYDYFLSFQEQKTLKEVFLQLSKNEKIFEIYTNLGINKSIIKKAFDDVQKLKPLHLNELVRLKTFENLKYFLSENKNPIIFLKNYKDKDKIKEITNKKGGDYFDFVDSLNQSFHNLKTISIKLKLMGLLLAFVFLWLFYGMKKSFLMIGLVLTSSLLTLFALTLLGFSINIFCIFGLILASAIGIDYAIFSQNSKLDTTQKLLGITLASMTSMVSFFTLSFSSTEAVRVFGLSVGICIFLCAVFSSLVCVNTKRNSYM
ncbi:MAG: hypothetical protein KGV43_03260 [Arcobacter sp.]|nr:hypothetical protein [Arcobacter sp.]